MAVFIENLCLLQLARSHHLKLKDSLLSLQSNDIDERESALAMNQQQKSNILAYKIE